MKILILSEDGDCLRNLETKISKFFRARTSRSRYLRKEAADLEPEIHPLNSHTMASTMVKSGVFNIVICADKYVSSMSRSASHCKQQPMIVAISGALKQIPGAQLVMGEPTDEHISTMFELALQSRKATTEKA